jgi:hypothetical protein
MPNSIIRDTPMNCPGGPNAGLTALGYSCRLCLADGIVSERLPASAKLKCRHWLTRTPWDGPQQLIDEQKEVRK